MNRPALLQVYKHWLGLLKDGDFDFAIIGAPESHRSLKKGMKSKHVLTRITIVKDSPEPTNGDSPDVVDDDTEGDAPRKTSSSSKQPTSTTPTNQPASFSVGGLTVPRELVTGGQHINVEKSKDFLLSLSNEANYQELVTNYAFSERLVCGYSILLPFLSDYVLQDDFECEKGDLPVIEPGPPAWARFSYNSCFLPAEPHKDLKALDPFYTWVKKVPFRSKDGTMIRTGVLDMVCLGLGMILRDTEYANRPDEEMDEEAPSYIRKSKFAILTTFDTVMELSKWVSGVVEEILAQGEGDK